jgi:hypothetical protein
MGKAIANLIVFESHSLNKQLEQWSALRMSCSVLLIKKKLPWNISANPT